MLLTLTALFGAGNSVVFLRESLQLFHLAGAALTFAGSYLATARRADSA